MENYSIKRFLANYGYYFGVGLSVLALIIIFAIAFTNRTVAVNESNDFEPVSSPVITFSNPVNDVNLLKGYSNSALQYNTTLKLWQAHKAIDFSAEEGTDVLAVMDGKVKEVTYNYMLGNIVKLDVGGGMVVVYASLQSDVPVKQGDSVKKGSVIGHVGTTAKSEASDGPHLHLEVWLDDENVDPNLYLDLANK